MIFANLCQLVTKMADPISHSTIIPYIGGYLCGVLNLWLLIKICMVDTFFWIDPQIINPMKITCYTVAGNFVKFVIYFTINAHAQ